MDKDNVLNDFCKYQSNKKATVLSRLAKILLNATNALNSHPIWTEAKSFHNTYKALTVRLLNEKLVQALKKLSKYSKRIIDSNLSELCLDLAKKFLLDLNNLNEILIPSRQQLEYLLRQICSTAQLLWEASNISKEGFYHSIQELSMEHLLPTVLMGLSMTARISILCKSFLTQLCDLYQKLKPWMNKLKIGNSELSDHFVLPENLWQWVTTKGPIFDISCDLNLKNNLMFLNELFTPNGMDNTEEGTESFNNGSVENCQGAVGRKRKHDDSIDHHNSSMPDSLSQSIDIDFSPTNYSSPSSSNNFMLRTDDSMPIKQEPFPEVLSQADNNGDVVYTQEEQIDECPRMFATLSLFLALARSCNLEKLFLTWRKNMHKTDLQFPVQITSAKVDYINNVFGEAFQKRIIEINQIKNKNDEKPKREMFLATETCIEIVKTLGFIKEDIEVGDKETILSSNPVCTVLELMHQYYLVYMHIKYIRQVKMLQKITRCIQHVLVQIYAIQSGSKISKRKLISAQKYIFSILKISTRNLNHQEQ